MHRRSGVRRQAVPARPDPHAATGIPSARVRLDEPGRVAGRNPFGALGHNHDAPIHDLSPRCQPVGRDGDPPVTGLAELGAGPLGAR
jgi:hypothetical protein